MEQHELGQVIAAPFQMKTGPELPGREPDLLFIARENLGRLEGMYLDGPADFAIENACVNWRWYSRNSNGSDDELMNTSRSGAMPATQPRNAKARSFSRLGTTCEATAPSAP